MSPALVAALAALLGAAVGAAWRPLVPVFGQLAPANFSVTEKQEYQMGSANPPSQAAGPAREYCRSLGAPLVVKADGLAGGKGAIVCGTLADADAAIARCLERREFGVAGATVVIEEFLRGEEASFFAIANGETCVALAAARHIAARPRYGTATAVADRRRGAFVRRR